MPHDLTHDALEHLRVALSGHYRVHLGEDVTVVWSELPGRAVCTATRVDGRLWVVLDPDKPGACRHARAMLSEWRCEQEPTPDFDDDELTRDWQAAQAIPAPRAEEPPTDVVVVPRLTAYAQVVLTGAAASVAAMAALLDQVTGGPFI